MTTMIETRPRLAPEKFQDPDVTVKDAARASVDFRRLRTLWFNTGTLCNIECLNCYIESSPTNDALVYLTRAEAASYLDEIDEMGMGAVEIGFTGGEPFMNPAMTGMAEDALERGHEVLILTNAMTPMMRPRVKTGLLDLKERFGDRLTLRISIDHYSEAVHDAERGEGSFAKTLEGMRWLSAHGFRLDAAARSLTSETEAEARHGFALLFEAESVDIPADDPSRMVIFPEMDETVDVPEITTECWGILSVDPASMMCATSRMVVKRKGAKTPAVIACTLTPYADGFEMAQTLKDALGPVKLNHPHCAKFCVLGGASCSA